MVGGVEARPCMVEARGIKSGGLETPTGSMVAEALSELEMSRAPNTADKDIGEHSSVKI